MKQPYENPCDACGLPMKKRLATDASRYKYAMSGLDDVYLIGINVYRCPKCQSEVPVIPKIAELHRTIAKSLVLKPGLLTGKEIRFLRKNAGIQANRFANLLGLDPSHLSRIENGKIDNLGPASDKLARAIASIYSNPHHLAELCDLLFDELKRQKRATVFGLNKDHWESRRA